MLAWAPAMVSGPFSSTFPTLAKTSSCAIGPQVNFPE